MAILQVVTASKADGGFTTFEEAQTAYSTSANADALKSYLISAQTAGEYTVEVSWDVETQTITYNRTWDAAAYDAFIAAQDDNRQAAKTSAEADGWVISGSVTTV